MKIQALGRYLLVKTEYDMIDEMQKRQTIVLPPEYMNRLKGGVQIHTILSIGESVFDDEPPGTREKMKVGRKVITGRYPGHEIDFDPTVNDQTVQKYRMISCDEIHALIAEDGEDGYDVRSR